MSLNNKLQFTFTSLLYMTLYQADLINTEIAEMKIYKLVVCVFTPLLKKLCCSIKKL